MPISCIFCFLMFGCIIQGSKRYKTRQQNKQHQTERNKASALDKDPVIVGGVLLLGCGLSFIASFGSMKILLLSSHGWNQSKTLHFLLRKPNQCDGRSIGDNYIRSWISIFSGFFRFLGFLPFHTWLFRKVIYTMNIHSIYISSQYHNRKCQKSKNMPHS